MLFRSRYAVGVRSFTAGFLLVVCLAPLASSLRANVVHRLDGTTLSAGDAEAIASTELKSDHVAGAQIAILNDSRVVWTYAFGVRDAGKQLPMTADTNVWAASITKSVFATWVMRLTEQYRLDLDEPIAKILPRPLNEYEPYRESASALVLDTRWKQVTPRMLLSHSTGLANFASLEPDRKLHLHFTPGTRFAYSGDGLNILQFAIEQKLHLTLDRAMRQASSSH